jgi:transcriptional regulator with XRE-family HTH domain
MSKTKSLYPNIEAERARKGITLENLSELLGISRKTFYNWVYKGNIPQSKLEAMANLFGVSVDYLLASE